MRLFPLVVSLPALTLAVFIGVRPDLYVVQTITFEGQDRATPAELRHLVGLPNGTRIWGLDLDRAAQGVQRHPWVQSANVRFEWPATVRVHVDERRPVALLRHQGLFYVDARGARIAPATTDDIDYPVLSGIDPSLAELHPELPERVVQSALELIQALGERADIPAQNIAELRFSRSAGFTVYLIGGARLLVNLDGFERQVDRLPALVAQGVRLDGPIHIDLAPPSVAIVRPLEVNHVDG